MENSYHMWIHIFLRYGNSDVDKINKIMISCMLRANSYFVSDMLILTETISLNVLWTVIIG